MGANAALAGVTLEIRKMGWIGAGRGSRSGRGTCGWPRSPKSAPRSARDTISFLGYGGSQGIGRCSGLRRIVCGCGCGWLGWGHGRVLIAEFVLVRCVFRALGYLHGGRKSPWRLNRILWFPFSRLGGKVCAQFKLDGGRWGKTGSCPADRRSSALIPPPGSTQINYIVMLGMPLLYHTCSEKSRGKCVEIGVEPQKNVQPLTGTKSQSSVAGNILSIQQRPRP